jgi:hypothetical protein
VLTCPSEEAVNCFHGLFGLLQSEIVFSMLKLSAVGRSINLVYFSSSILIIFAASVV